MLGLGMLEHHLDGLFLSYSISPMVVRDRCNRTRVCVGRRHIGQQAREALLAQIHSLTGVTGTRSFIALSTYLDRPVQAEVTESWPVVPLPHD